MDTSNFIGLYESYLDVYAQEEVEEIDGDILNEELTGSRLQRAQGKMKQMQADLKKPGNKGNVDLYRSINALHNVSGNREGSSTPGQGKNELDFKGPRGRGGRGYKGGPKTVGQQGSLDRPSSNKTSQSTLKSIRRHEKKNLNNSYEYDAYDLVLEYLLDEGFTDTIEGAELIMVNMSKDWIDELIAERRISNKKPYLDHFDKNDPDDYADGAYAGSTIGTLNKTLKNPNTTKSSPKRKPSANKISKFQREDIEYILEYLLDEGFTDNLENAMCIVDVMSDEWLDDILEAALTPSQAAFRRSINAPNEEEREKEWQAILRIRAAHNKNKEEAKKRQKSESPKLGDKPKSTETRKPKTKLSSIQIR